MNLKDKIRTVPDWPAKGIMFRDITTLIQDADAFRETCDQLYERYKDKDIDKIAGIDARGFIFGAVLAYKMDIGFIPVRKKGKLPYKTIEENYSLEYGVNTIELHEDAVSKGEKVLIVDDLIATGGTVKATINLIERLGGVVYECAFVVELPELGGRKKLEGYKIFSLMEFEGE